MSRVGAFGSLFVLVVMPCPVSKRATLMSVRTDNGGPKPVRPMAMVSWRPSSFYWVPTFLNAGGAREKPGGSRKLFYLCNVPKSVPGYVPEDR